MNSHTASSGKFTKILFAVDGAPHSTGAVNAVATIAKASKAKVHVLHVWDPEARVKGGPWDIDTVAEAEDLVDGIASQLTAAGLAATSEVRQTSDKNPGCDRGRSPSALGRPRRRRLPRPLRPRGTFPR